MNLRNKLLEAHVDQILIASGRSASLGLVDAGRRIRFDRSVAIWIPYVHQYHAGKLLLEAVSDGWWYATPAIQHASNLVFITEADLIPKTGAARAKWLARMFDETKLLNVCARFSPSFSAISATDAHFGMHPTPAFQRGARIGAAALALDPLSGTGVVNAVEGALRAANDVILGHPLSNGYACFIRNIAANEARLHQHTYLKAAQRFPHSAFWQRRIALSKHIAIA
ncbi:MAG TPA: hypothetical protein VMA74_09860 [Dyella sp.]|uniref:hypothetical protein n=1 Tax=Dyella sp. TaxID=1869338 RepID=UPI002C03E3E9|nr:hypothetical protein [Dyella sp.]HUB90017.1 hypothetical protein [Dyella sp.]